MKRYATFGVAAVFAIATAACSSDSSSSAGAGSSGAMESPDTSNTVGATLKDFSIALDPTTLGSGEITFNITNEGPSTHEFVVVRSDLAPDALPVKDDEVEEGTLDAIGEQEESEREETHARRRAQRVHRVEPRAHPEHDVDLEAAGQLGDGEEHERPVEGADLRTAPFRQDEAGDLRGSTPHRRREASPVEPKQEACGEHHHRHLVGAGHGTGREVVRRRDARQRVGPAGPHLRRSG